MFASLVRVWLATGPRYHIPTLDATPPFVQGEVLRRRGFRTPWSTSVGAHSETAARAQEVLVRRTLQYALAAVTQPPLS